MSDRPPSLRPSRYTDDFPGGRRKAPRCEARLQVFLQFVLSPPEAGAIPIVPPSPEMPGETCNLSETGLAVCLPSNHIGHRYFNTIGSTLHLRLELPDGPVRILATSRWGKWLVEETVKSYMLGLSITGMRDEEWVRLVRYVHACM